MPNTSHFDRLRAAALMQPEPQRLLFVFAAAELPPDADAAQRARFAAGQGGTLTPQMCVDKAPDELAGFDALVAESRQAGPPWDVVFVAGLGGSAGRPPEAQRIEQALQAMVEAVKGGAVGRFAAYDRQGENLLFE